MAIGKEYIDKRLRKCKSTDYTKWQRQRFDDVDADEFYQAAIAYSIKNPFRRSERRGGKPCQR